MAQLEISSKRGSLSLNVCLKTDPLLFTESRSAQGLRGSGEGSEQSEKNEVQKNSPEPLK